MLTRSSFSVAMADALALLSLNSVAIVFSCCCSLAASAESNAKRQDHRWDSHFRQQNVDGQTSASKNTIVRLTPVVFEADSVAASCSCFDSLAVISNCCSFWRALSSSATCPISRQPQVGCSQYQFCKHCAAAQHVARKMQRLRHRQRHWLQPQQQQLRWQETRRWRQRQQQHQQKKQTE